MPIIEVVTDHNFLADITVGQLIGVLVTLGVIVGFIRKINPIMHRLNDLLDDWNGQSARPGVPERKGVMERLSDQDEVLSHLRRKVEPLVDETQAGNHKEVVHKLNEISNSTKVNVDHLNMLERLLKRHIRESRSWVDAVDRAGAEHDFEVPKWPELPDSEDQ